MAGSLEWFLWGNGRDHPAFWLSTEHNFLLSKWSSCSPSTVLNLRCWEMVITPIIFNSVKWNFRPICDWSHWGLQCRHLVQLLGCFSLQEEGWWVKRNAAELSPSFATAGLRTEARVIGKSIWSSEAFASDCFKKQKRKLIVWKGVTQLWDWCESWIGVSILTVVQWLKRRVENAESLTSVGFHSALREKLQMSLLEL